jgi:hypothetical protein
MEPLEETGDDDDPNDKVTEIQLMKDYASFFDADDQNDSDIKRAHRKSFVQKCYGEPSSEGQWTFGRNVCIRCHSKLKNPLLYLSVK